MTGNARKRGKEATGTREWRPYSENCMLGCEYDCGYCYAALRADRFKQRIRKDWHTMQPNMNRLRRPVNYLKGGVMFPTSHDLQMVHAQFWAPFLSDLLGKGNDVLIVSKPALDVIRYICEEFSSRKDQIEFRFTIGTSQDQIRQFWEPGAPSITERILSLQYAFRAGFKTSVSMEPLLQRDPRPLIQEVENMIPLDGTIWIGTMNHLRPNMFDDPVSKKHFQEQLVINSWENMKTVHASLKDHPKIRWKDSVQKLLGIPQRSCCE